MIWVDIEDNSYIKFQSDGSTIAIDPTYGLNAGSTTNSGSCSAACTKLSVTDISGQCCSCNGTKRYALLVQPEHVSLLLTRAIWR